MFSKKLGIVFFFFLNIILLIKLGFFESQLSGKNPLFDFDAYHLLLHDIKAGINPYSVDHMQSLGPPLVFVYFSPFGYLALQKARTLTTFINIISGIAICQILANKYYPKNIKVVFLIFTLVLFSSFPVRFSIEIGQPALFTTLLITLILTIGEKRIKGIALSILATIKTFFFFSFLAFARKNRKIFWISFWSAIFILCASFILIKPAWYIYYFNEKLPNLISTNKPPSGIDYYNQSLKSTIHRLGLFNVYQPVFLISGIITAFLVFSTGNFELSVLLAILLSPISWQHYYVILFPIFIKTISKIKGNPKLVLILLISLFLWWVEFPQLHQANITFVNGLLASHYFFSGLILVFLALYTLKNKNIKKLANKFKQLTFHID